MTVVRGRSEFVGAYVTPQSKEGLRREAAQNNESMSVLLNRLLEARYAPTEEIKPK